MNGTGARGDEQAAPVVLVQQTGTGHYLEVAHRVRHKTRHFQQFVLYGQHLPQQRVGGVAALHERHIGLWHPQPEPRGGLLHTGQCGTFGDG